MTIRIYDFDDNAVKIENPDKSIKRITELEYIESSETQYVDTGVVPNNKGGVHYIDKNRIEAAVKTLRRRTERGEDR